MASWSEENLRCPVCQDIFKDPVLLSCSHTFCKACWQCWWKEKYPHKCPVCQTKSSMYNPPTNLVAKNLCEDFAKERDQKRTAEKDRRRPVSLCALHSEDLKLFCLDHQEPVCVICLHSRSHTNHSFSPLDEAAADRKEGLRELLKPLQETLGLFNDIKGNFDQSAKDIEHQTQDAERQIKDEVSMLWRVLQKEQRRRIDAVRQEKKQKKEVIRRKTEDLSREIAALSDTVRATEEVLRVDNLAFLQGYKAAAELVAGYQLSDPQPVQGGLIDTAKHLNNLPFVILDSMKNRIQNPVDLKQQDDPQLQRNHLGTTNYCHEVRSCASRLMMGTRGFNLTRYKSVLPPAEVVLKSFNEKQQTIIYDNDDDLYG